MTVGKVPHVILGQEMLKPKDGLFQAFGTAEVHGCLVTEGYETVGDVGVCAA